jgi:hypothetical protein
VRAAKGSTITIRSDPFDGAPTPPTATVTRADGSELTAPAVDVDGNQVTVVLTAVEHLDRLDQLTVEITADVDGAPQTQVVEVDVIGSHWVTLGALRTEPQLTNAAQFSDDLLREVRDEWESHIEHLCNLRMTPGYGVERVTGTGATSLMLATEEVTAIRAVAVDGEIVDVADCTLGPHGTLTRLAGFGRGLTVEVHLEHGLRRPPPKLVREVRKAVTRELLARGAHAPTDAIRETSPEGGVTIQYSTPDPSAGRWTGILSLDPVITEYRRAPVLVA